jgi:hypothetical protein
MAWEWVAPVAGSVATVVIGVTGIVTTYRAGNRQQDTALMVGRQQVDAQVAVSREERQQRRLEEAYLEMFGCYYTRALLGLYRLSGIYPYDPRIHNAASAETTRNLRGKKRYGQRTGRLALNS